MRVKKIYSALAVASLLCYGACNKDDDNNNNNNNNNNTVNQTDRDFMMNAAYGNNAEIDAGSMAASKGTDSSVKMFGQMMVSDHSTAQTELQSVAAQTSVTLPTGLDSAHQAMKAQLQSMSGHTFDSVYIHSQVMDHQKTISLFQNESSNGSNQRVKDYANKYLPIIQTHYQKADSISRHL
jgi:putative membrane protein